MRRHRKFAQTALGILRIMGDCVVASFWVGTDDILLLLGFTLKGVSSASDATEEDISSSQSALALGLQ